MQCRRQPMPHLAAPPRLQRNFTFPRRGSALRAPRMPRAPPRVPPRVPPRAATPHTQDVNEDGRDVLLAWRGVARGIRAHGVMCRRAAALRYYTVSPEDSALHARHRRRDPRGRKPRVYTGARQGKHPPHTRERHTLCRRVCRARRHAAR